MEIQGRGSKACIRKPRDMLIQAWGVIILIPVAFAILTERHRRIHTPVQTIPHTFILSGQVVKARIDPIQYVKSTPRAEEFKYFFIDCPLPVVGNFMQGLAAEDGRVGRMEKFDRFQIVHIT